FQAPVAGGNQAMQRMVQAKLRTPAAPDDSEREADEVADDVVSPGESGSTPSAAGSGELHAADRARLQAALGHDLSSVRLHSDGAAALRAAALNARAYTSGRDIYFGAGEYATETLEGRRLLAHELVHVAQQARSMGSGTIQRQEIPGTAPPDAAAEQAFTDAANQLSTIAFPRFQEALDILSETAVQDAGLITIAMWMNLEGAKGRILNAAAAAAPPDQTAPATGTPDQTTPAPAPAVQPSQAAALSPELQGIYDDRRRQLLIALTAQKFQGTWVNGAERLPPYMGDVGEYVKYQTAELAWLAKDTQALIDLLGRQDLPEADQWTAIGLLRQHMNPWDFAFMLAAARSKDVLSCFDRFSKDQREGFRTLLQVQGQYASDLTIEPIGGMRPFDVLPAERKVRLVQPLSPNELAEILYGKAARWATDIKPFNRGLEGASASAWLPVGTEVVVSPETMLPEYAQFFMAVIRGEQVQEKRGMEPYIWASPEEIAVVGNSVTYGVNWPNVVYDHADLEWWIENDPAAVRKEGVPARVDAGRGRISGIGGSQYNVSFSAKAAVPGNHTVRCRISTSYGAVYELSYTQIVLTLEQQTSLQFQRDFAVDYTTKELVDKLKKERDKLGKDDTKRRNELTRQIEAIEAKVAEADKESRQYLLHDSNMRGIKALYVSSEEKPMAVPLSLFIGSDPGYFDSPDINLKVWDFTIPNDIRYYPGAARHPQDAIKDALRRMADDAPYPTGNIRFEITPATYSLSGVYNETVTYPTDGGTRLAATLRGIALGATVLGGVAAVLLQEEIAVPLFVIAGLAAGAGGLANMADRISHGDFEWDTQALLDVLDIAAGVLTAGMASGALTAGRGLGQVTLSGRIQIGIGQAQLGVMAGIHASSISAAVSTGNKDEVARAILNAARDGALVLFVHRASARLRSRVAERQVEVNEGLPGTRTVTGGTTSTEPSPATRTAGGTARGGVPSTVPEEATVTARPGTPEAFRQQHEAWVRRIQTEGMGQRGVAERPTPTGEPITRITTVERNITDPNVAYRVYEESLARAPGREVGIFRNVNDGTYAVRVGDAHSVSAPMGDGWESVLHYHPNRGNVLSIRMPAPADVLGTARHALAAGRPVTEFVEVQLPGTNQRGITSYTVSTRPVEIAIEYQRPDGSRVRRTYSSIEEYQAAYFERTT
ncbi:MAG TPA: DUF4157 domain-containing protein, partial [Dehalococcoidia bacterium]